MNGAQWWLTLDRAGFQAAWLLLSALWQSSILLAAAGLLVWFLRRRRASVRQAVLAAAVLASPLIPLLGWAASRSGTPRAAIPVVPAYSGPVEPTSPLVPPAPVPDYAQLRAVPPVDQTPPPEPAFAAPTPPTEPTFSVLHCPWALALLAYAAVAGGLIGLVAIGKYRIGRWARRGQVVTDARVLDIFGAARQRLGLDRDITVVESPRPLSPITTGTLHPVVLLPAGLAADSTDEDLSAIALHELAHVRRRDSLLLTLLSLVRAALFFHPLIWLACRQAAALAEIACDDAVLDATAQPVSYARMLARMAERLPAHALATELSAGIVLSKSAFLRRVEAILSDRRAGIRRLSRLALAATVAASVLSVLLAISLPLGEKRTGPEFSVGRITLHMNLDSGRPIVTGNPRPVVTVSDPGKIAELLRFFPQLGRSSWRAGGWMAGAIVELTKADGGKVRIIVSENDDLQVWSEGEGDWPVKGDLKAFLRTLLKQGAATQAAADAAEVDRLIRQLGSERFADREEAHKKLMEVGLPALKALRLAASGSEAERAAHAKAVRSEIVDAAFQVRIGQAVVRLLGVSTVPTGTDTWWLPNGEPLDAPPPGGSDLGTSSGLTHTFGIEVSGTDRGAVIQVKIAPTDGGQSSSSSGIGNLARKFIRVSPAPGSGHVAVDVGISQGDWERFAEGAPGRTVKDAGGGEVTISQVTQKKDRAEVTGLYTVDPAWRYRLTLIKSDGSVLLGGSTTSINGRTRRARNTSTFAGASPADVAGIRLERRKIEWVRFGNVSAVRGSITDFIAGRSIAAEQVGKVPLPAGVGETVSPATPAQERFLETVRPELAEVAAGAYAHVDRRDGLLVGPEAESARKAYGKAYGAFERKVVAAWPFGDKATKQSRREYAALSNRIRSMTRSQAVAKLIEFADAHRGQPERHAALHRAAYLYLDRVGDNRDEPAARAMLERLAADLEFGATSFTVFAEQNLVWLRLPRNATADDRVRAYSDFYLRLEGLKGLAAVVRMVFRPSEKVRPEDWASCVNAYLLNLRSAQNNTRANLVAPRPDQAAYTLQTPDPAKTLRWLRQRHAGDPVFVRAIDETLRRLTANPGPATLPDRTAVDGASPPEAAASDALPLPATQPAVVAAESRLEFRVAPKPSDLDKGELASCMHWLRGGRVGFWWKGGRIRGRMPDHAWLPISGELTNAKQLVTGEHKGRKHVLVSDKPGQTMVPGEGKDAWGLAKVYVTADGMGRPAVGFEPDDRGAELFAALTKANIGSALAVVVDGKVTAAPIIKAALGKRGMIPGQFTGHEAAALVKALRAGMPPGGGKDSPASSRPAVGRAATVPADAPEWVKAALAAMPGARWEVERFDRKPSLTVDGRQGSRLVLRQGHKEYQDLPMRQRGPYSAEELRNARFVMRYRHVELAAFRGGPLAGEAVRKLHWTEWDEKPSHFKKVVHLGQGLGMSWYAKATIFDQEWLRKGLGLKGGDDRLALLTEAMSVKDEGSTTRGSCQYILAAAGDKAIPYIKAAVEKNRRQSIAVLGRIRTDAATEYLQELYRAEPTRPSAARALIYKPFRPAAKKEYLEMLRRRRYVFQPARACVEFRWKEAIPLLEAIYLRPRSTGEFEAAFRAKRTLEGRPVPAEIDEAQKLLTRSAYAKAPPTREALAAAEAALMESKDTEAAAVIAIRLVLFGAKANRDRVEVVRKIGREVLRELPRKQTEEIVLRLARSLEANRSWERQAKELLKILSSEEDEPRRPAGTVSTPTRRLSPSALRPGSPVAPYPGAIPSGGRPAQPAAEVAEIERLIRQLGSDRFAEREAAQKALVAIGEPALPALAAARRDANVELAQGAGLAREQILKACRPPPPFYDLARSGVKKIGPDGKLPDGRFCERRGDFIFDNAEALALYRKGKRYDRMYCKPAQADRRKAAGFYAQAIQAQPYARVNAAIANRIAQMYAFNPPTDPRTAQHWWQVCAEMTGPHQVLWFQAGMGLGSAGVMTRERDGALANYQAILDVDTARVEPPEWVFRTGRKQYDLDRESARRHMARVKAKAVEKIAYVLRGDREKTLAAMRKIAEEHKGTPAGEKAAEILGRLGATPASTTGLSLPTEGGPAERAKAESHSKAQCPATDALPFGSRLNEAPPLLLSCNSCNSWTLVSPSSTSVQSV